MKYLLDTTYFLPVIGISVRNISGDDIARFRSANPGTAMCEISTFELGAKAAKYISEGKLDGVEVSTGIEVILNDDSLLKIPSFASANLLVTFKLRTMLNDFIDCLILAAAINYADALLTEDRYILDLRQNQKFKELLKSRNPKFEIERLTRKI